MGAIKINGATSGSTTITAPATGGDESIELSTALASKLPYSYGTATPSTTDSGFLWYDSNSTPAVPKFWDGSSFQTIIDGAWTAYTPGTSGITIGNGTEIARYVRIGDLIALTYIFILGSTSAITGTVSVPLPVNANTSGGGVAVLTNIGVLNYAGSISLGPSAFSLQAVGTGSTYGTLTGVTATVPFIWGAGDQIKANLVYEAV